jgi:4-diphosphocytidyl-2-C-methyl-D-erythritol kinase
MVPISLYDTVQIGLPSRIAEIRVACDHPQVPSGGKNLAYKAAQLLLERTETRRGVSIHIRKRIPIGSGLGGGSSDAATVLKGLNQLLDLKIGEKQLMRIGGQIGADVPFFIPCQPAHVSGIGERVRVLAGFPRLWLLVIYPGFQIQTSFIYSSVSLTKSQHQAKSKAFFSHGALNLSSLRNDLEAVAMRWHPEIADMKKRLAEHGAKATLMTGSGSSVFGVFSSRQLARKAQISFRKMPQERVFLAYSTDGWAVAKR